MKNKKTLKAIRVVAGSSLFATALLVALPGLVSADVVSAIGLGLYNTGVQADGVTLQAAGAVDLHYSLTVVPSGSSITEVGTATGGAPIPPWITSASSEWIGPHNNNTGNLDGPVGNYTYETTFNMGDLDPTSFVLTGQWSTDNAGLNILVNGTPTGNTIAVGSPGSYSFESFHAFTLSSAFTSGENTLDFVINNLLTDPPAVPNPTGLDIEFSSVQATEATATPEPGTFGMLFLASAGLALGWNKRSRRA